MTETSTRRSKAKEDMKQRILTLCDALGISQNNFSVSIGKSSGYVSNMPGDINSAVLRSIIRVYPQVSMHWLLTGEGEPLIDPNAMDSQKQYERLLSMQKTQIKELKAEVTALNREIGGILKELEIERELTDSLKKQLASCLKTAKDNSPVPAD